MQKSGQPVGFIRGQAQAALVSESLEPPQQRPLRGHLFAVYENGSRRI